MSSGLFILMNSEERIKDDINTGVYGFLMPPIYEEEVPTRSRHYAVLCDYACCSEGTEIFFFSKRKVVYGGRITKNNENNPVFYLNGDTSPICRKAKSELFVDMSNVFERKEHDGVYQIYIKNSKRYITRSMPYIIEFERNELSGKQISSDELYFELGKYNFPLPSNAIQKMGMCTLTPRETEILMNLMEESEEEISLKSSTQAKILNHKRVSFYKDLIDEKISNEQHLEFLLLADNEKLKSILTKTIDITKEEKFVKGRQIPLSPFKPMQFDRADICLYDLNNPIKNKSLPNILIELKKDRANYEAYEQVTRYLKWIEEITSNEEFKKVRAIIIAPDFKRTLNINELKKRKITLKYYEKIKLFSLDKDEEIKLN